MKKVLSIVLILLLFLLTSCGKSKQSGITVKRGSDFSQGKETVANASSPDLTKTVLDPFDGIRFETAGISPKCTVSINNQNCSVDVQEKVTYSLDKKYYANGETAIITAQLSGYNDNQKYSLSSETTQWTIENQPEYIMSPDDIDLSQIKPELDDFVKSTIAKETHADIRWSLLGASVTGADEVKDLRAGDTYFLGLKLQKEVEDNSYYNYLTFTYSGKYISEQEVGNFYTCISAVNLIKYPDGKIKWGSESTDGFDFITDGSTKGMEDCIDKTIIIHSDNYNITKLEEKS